MACSVMVLAAEEFPPSPKLIGVLKTALMPVWLTGPPLLETSLASFSLKPSAWNLKRVCNGTTDRLRGGDRVSASFETTGRASKWGWPFARARRSRIFTHQEEIVDFPVGLIPLFSQLLRTHLLVVIRLSLEGSDEESDEFTLSCVLDG